MKIKQITGVTKSLQIYGLGDDNKVYRWDMVHKEWVLHGQVEER